MIDCPYDCGGYENGLILCRPAGILTPETIDHFLACRDQLEEEAGKPLDRFIDMRKVTGIELGYQHTSRFAEAMANRAQGKRIVMACFLVVNEVQYGMARMYQALVDGRGLEVHISYEVEELARILGVPDFILLGEQPPSEPSE